MKLLEWLRGIATEKNSIGEQCEEEAFIRLPNGEYEEVDKNGIRISSEGQQRI